MNMRWLNEKGVNDSMSPYDTYVNNMNIFSDIEVRMQQHKLIKLATRKHRHHKELVLR
jgi:hypothetical protein